jgi:hypothetical protein
MTDEYSLTRKCNECKKVKPNDEKNYGKGNNAMCNDCYYYDEK